MATVTGGYDQLRSSTNLSAVFYMDPEDRRTETFDIFGMMPGGVVFKVQSDTKPETFDQDFPQAIRVEMFDL